VSALRARADLLLGVFLTLLAVAAQLTRQPGTPAWDSMWQEDGGIFLYSPLADGNGLLHDLFDPYNGYLHWAPRVIAQFASLFPLDQMARLMAGLDTLVVALCSAFIYFASARILRSRWARFAMAAAPILLPAAGFEAAANVTNLHWYLTFAAFWACVQNPRSPRAIAVAAVVVWFAVMSDPSTFAFVPVLLIQMWRDGWRRPSAWVLPGVFALGFVLQLLLAVLVEGTNPYAGSVWSDVPAIYGLRVAGSFLVGDLWIDNFWNKLGDLFAYGSVVVVAAICAYAYLRSRDVERRLFVVVCVVYSVGLFASSAILRGTEGFLDKGAEFSLNGSRYTLLPILLLVAVALVALESPDPRLSPRAWRGVQVAVACFAAFIVLNNFAIPSTRSAGPSWKTGVAAARQKCEGRLPQDTVNVASTGRARPRPGDYVVIFISPFALPRPPWGVTVSCRDVLAG
jgi:hypothetical protein